jgi:GTPase SAR1 family protein
MEYLKLVVLGDNKIGKTSLLLKYTTGKYYEDNIPSFENKIHSQKYNGKQIALALMEDNNEIKKNILFSDTNIFILCFSVDDENSLLNIKEKYIPEIKNFMKEKDIDIPFIICGLRTDLRNDEKIRKELEENKKEVITFEIGLNFSYDNNSLGNLI